MNGEEFYNFKMQRDPGYMTDTEKEVYASGEWVDWLKLARDKATARNIIFPFRRFSEYHLLHYRGFLDIQGIMKGDDYRRVTNRINVDSKVNKWLTLGTRTHFSLTMQAGLLLIRIQVQQE